MYTATMHYRFKPGYIEEACALWESEVLTRAKGRPGMVRMQFLVDRQKSEALAVGTWKRPEDAQAFMQTGVFKELMIRIQDMLADEPSPHIWDLRLYVQS